MKCGTRIGVTAAAIMSCSVPAYPHDQDTDNIADVRCFVVGIMLVQNPSPQLQTAGQMTALYYVGRLDGRAPNFEIESAIVEQLTKMTPKDLSAEAVRCGHALTDKGNKITELGKSLLNRSQKMQEQEGKASK